MELADHATAKLARMMETAATLHDEDVDDLTRGFAACVLPMIEALRADPTRHPALQRHLSLYVDAATDATDRFAQRFAALREPEVKAPYLEHLCDLAQHFTSEMASLRATW